MFAHFGELRDDSVVLRPQSAILVVFHNMTAALAIAGNFHSKLFAAPLVLSGIGLATIGLAGKGKSVWSTSVSLPPTLASKPLMFTPLPNERFPASGAHGLYIPPVMKSA